MRLMASLVGDMGEAAESVIEYGAGRNRGPQHGCHGMLFKNHGEEAGANLEHPHSQIIAVAR